MIPIPGNIGVIACAADRRLGCLALRLTAVGAVAADLDMEAAFSSSGVVLLCFCRLDERQGCWGELACGGGGLIRPGAAAWTSRVAQLRPILCSLAVPFAAACRGAEARACDEGRRPVARGFTQPG